VGLAIGAGYYMGALLTTGLVFLTLTILSKIEKKDYQHVATLVIKTIDQPGQIGQIGSIIGKHGIHIRNIKIDENGNQLVITFTLYMTDCIKTNDLTLEISDIQGISGVKLH
jgi:putative Mg2+ transporter-C (MgtC) family protein